ncbi:MAG: chorismate synthase [Bacteroidales bacterium]|nr:chorismate synthase [Bacteroidales bacterium]
MNSFGSKFRLTTYGESHGIAVGGIIDGCPSGLHIDFNQIEYHLNRRKQNAPRQESDKVTFLSGILDGITLGTPIAFQIANNSQQSKDYSQLEHCFRPGHADYTYQAKYGIRDHRGGGRASARETVVRVVAGSIARQLIPDIKISAWVKETSKRQINDSCGGIVSCRITNIAPGIGEPIFGRLNALLAHAMMTIPSAVGFEMGIGFEAAQMQGSEYADKWSCNADGTTITNNCGGIQGGISNGMPIEFNVAFHPVVSIPQPTDFLTDDGKIKNFILTGRHDNNHIERIPVIVESMAALVIVDLIL